MTAPAPDRAAEALGPVRAELLRAARADAGAVLDHAEREAARLLGVRDARPRLVGEGHFALAIR